MVVRREYIRGVAGIAGTGLAGGFAGCTGSEYPEGVDPEQAQAHYDDALAAFAENDTTLQDWAEGRPGRDKQTIDAMRDTVTRARDSLDDGEEVAPEEMMAQIDNARAIAGFQEKLLEYYEVGIEIEEAQSDAESFGDSEQHERAVQEYETVKDVLDQGRNKLEDVEAAHDEIDPDAIENPALKYRGEYTLHIDGDGPGTFDAKELMIDGRLNIHQMFVELNDGFEHYETEEFGVARERFKAAEEARLRSRDAFDAVPDHDSAWKDLRQDSIGFLGIVKDLAEAVELFIDATHEAEAGNHEKANGLVEEGFFVLEKAFENSG